MGTWVIKPALQCTAYKEHNDSTPNETNGAQKTHEHALSISEVFLFWQIAGGKLDNLLPEEMDILPAILRIPTIVRAEDLDHKKKQHKFLAIDAKSKSYKGDHIVPIPLKVLRDQLKAGMADSLAASMNNSPPEGNLTANIYT